LSKLKAVHVDACANPSLINISIFKWTSSRGQGFLHFTKKDRVGLVCMENRAKNLFTSGQVFEWEPPKSTNDTSVLLLKK
jgi:hypothetical protein